MGPEGWMWVKNWLCGQLRVAHTDHDHLHMWSGPVSPATQQQKHCFSPKTLRTAQNCLGTNSPQYQGHWLLGLLTCSLSLTHTHTHTHTQTALFSWIFKKPLATTHLRGRGWLWARSARAYPAYHTVSFAEAFQTSDAQSWVCVAQWVRLGMFSKKIVLESCRLKCHE